MVVRWLRFLRWPNLVIIAVTMVLVRQVVLAPHVTSFDMSNLAFAAMVLATMLIAAFGYVVNDVADLDIDLVNKPERVFVGRHISQPAADVAAGGLLVGAALLLVWALPDWTLWMLVFPAAAAALWAYAVYLKCAPLLGNLVVAGLSALVPWVVLVAEGGLVETTAPHVPTLVGAYIGFAFVASLFRELVKDLEDRDGDAAYGCQTLAVRSWGGTLALAIATGLGLLTGVTTFLLSVQAGAWAWGIAIGLVGLPALIAVERTARGAHGLASQMAKMVMLGGLVLLPILAS